MYSKIRPFVFCSIVILLTCSQSTYAQSSNIIDDHFKALAQHDVKAIANGYADDAQLFSPNWEGPKLGLTGITEVYTRYFASTPDLTYKVTNTINAGENIVVV